MVYVLRMQLERMGPGGFVPSLREYAATYGIDHARLRPGQRVMHAGPINRGVEISGALADDPATLIERQAANGMIVRMAVLYDLLAEPAAAVEPAEPIGALAESMAARLVQRPGPAASLVLRGARVLDPAAGIDEMRDLVVRDGRIGGAADGPGGGRRRGAWSRCPGFVNPHVHLRTPGREDLEDIATGTAAAAAGGFVTIVAMPNTSPVVDTASVLESLLERGEQEAAVRVGFLAAITAGQRGAELTEQVELARAGAAGFSDDGHPVADAGVMRRALQYQRITGAAAGAARGGPRAVGARGHARGGRGQPAGARRDPVDLRERGRRARRGAGRVRGRAHPHLPRLRRGDRRGDAPRQGARRAHHRRGHAAPPDPHRRRRRARSTRRATR